MQVNRAWLNDYMTTPLTDAVLAEKLTLGGFPARAVEGGLAVEVPAHRPDCLGVAGLARELAALCGVDFRLPEPQVEGGAEGCLIELLDVDAYDPGLCRRFTARLVRDAKVTASPDWMQARLLAHGIAPVNCFTDVARYVSLEYGQTVQALDQSALLEGRLVLRAAMEGEVLTTADGVERTLTPGMAVLADDWQTVALAGVADGVNSAVKASTADVVFCAASLDGETVKNTLSALNIQNPPAAHLAADTDPMLTLPAVDRCCELVEQLHLGQVMDGTMDVLNYVPHPTVLTLEDPAAAPLLASAGFVVEGTSVTVPSWRADLTTRQGLLDEAARFARCR